MAISYVGGSATQVSGTSHTSTSRTVPAGTTVGDVLIAWVYVYQQTPTAPAEWTLIASKVDGSDRSYCYRRVVQTGDPTTYTVSFPSTTTSRFSLSAYRGVDGVEPLAGAASAIAYDQAATAAKSTPTFVTAKANTWVVSFWATSNGGTWGAASGTTAATDTNGIKTAHETVAASGTTTTSRTSTNGNVNAAHTFAIGLREHTNTAPNAPTALSPDGTTVDKDTTQRFSWTFSDSDAGDSQSKYDLRYRLVGAATWTDVTGATPNTFHDFAAATFAASDYEWQVRTYDAQGVVGPYSASAFFSAATAPTAAAITDPINGGTVNTDPYAVTWSTPNQDAYQLRTVADSAGSPDTATVHTDTGTIESSTARSRSVEFDVNNRTEHIQIRIRHNGLWSAWTSHSVTVAYTPPTTPTIVVTADDVNEHITITVTNPTPTGSEPTVTSNEVHVRVAAGGRRDVDRTVGDNGIRIATGVPSGGSYIDRAVASSVAYEYRVKALGSNGVGAWSAWTA